MLAIRFIELTEPIEAPSGIENYSGVRFYCKMRGQIVGQFTVWHQGHPISRDFLIHEVSRQMASSLLWPLFERRLEGETEPYGNLQKLLRAQLGLEPQEFPPLPEEPAVASPSFPQLTASITIPSRDRPDDIRRCLESLTNHKSRVPFEIIVADNNPASGKTEPVVRSFPGVMYIPEPRPGVTFARNAAALHASGDIIVCSDDDVTYEEGWLDNLIAPYADPEVMGVTGMVVPYELEHEAQYWFEVYGGLTRNYRQTRYNRNFYDEPGNYMPMVPTWDIGVTANCSFRAGVFADPEVGPFDDTLRIAEDPYLLYRMVKANKIVVYEPRAVVRHRHRDTIEGLARQLYNYGRSSTGMQLRTFLVDGDIRGITCLDDVVRYDRDRVLDLLYARRYSHPLLRLFFKLYKPNTNYISPQRGHSNYPLKLVIAETKGHIVGPFSLLKSFFQVRNKLDHYTVEQFQLAQAARAAAKKAAQEAEHAPEQTAEPAEQQPELTTIA